ncbi:MAG: aldose 1-epimerase [Paraglaciecola sp.]|jgi:aldose 1-epimerase
MIISNIFGSLPDGQPVHQYSLTNGRGAQVDILTLGGIIRRWLVPGNTTVATDNADDIVLGFDTVEAYLEDQAYVGAVVGRYANRIAKGKFTLQGTPYQVDINQGGNCLHGGQNGFNRRLWQATILAQGDEPQLALSLVSPDGDQGFPGELTVKVIYTLSAQNGLNIEYFAKSTKATLFNPTQHSYFNLAGHQSGPVTQHQVQIFASRFTPTDDNAIPTGELASVTNTPLDLRELVTLATPLAATHPQLTIGNGFDHNWCVDAYQPDMPQPALVAKVVEPQSGRTLSVYSTMAGIQLYIANYLSAQPLGKEQTAYGANHALCLETQCYPDAPNQGHFPSAELKAGEAYYSVTEYRVTG